jgi:hypothetical protein
MWTSGIASYLFLSAVTVGAIPHTPTTTLRIAVARRDEAPPVSTISTPTDGHQSGDVIITIPEADNKWLSDILSQNVCPDFKVRKQKRFVGDCFLKDGDAIYDSMRDGGFRSFVDMANAGMQLPLPPLELDGGHMGELELMADGIPELDQRARGRLAAIVWWVQYPTLITHTGTENAVKVIPAVAASHAQAAPPAETSKRCHHKNAVPYCTNCGGDDSKGTRTICVGVSSPFQEFGYDYEC